MAVIISGRMQRAREEELAQAASVRGWKFDSRTEKGYRIHRWAGTTDGVAWVAESLRHMGGGNKQQRRRHIARWHGTWSPGVSGAIVAMGLPKGKEVPAFSIAEGDGFFAKMAQKAAGFAFDK